MMVQRPEIDHDGDVRVTGFNEAAPVMVQRRWPSAWTIEQVAGLQ